MSKNGVKKLIGNGIKFVIAAVVFAFLGLKSINFFMFTTPADQWYYAFLGFGLTGGGVIAYLLIFMWDADTDLKKTVAILMLAVCIIGELATAGFGLQIDTWQKLGYQMQQKDFDAMVLAVQLLGFAHAVALIAYVAGDAIGNALGDDDKDGTPNYRDPDYKKNKRNNFPQSNQPSYNQNALEMKIAELKSENATLRAGTEPSYHPMTELKAKTESDPKGSAGNTD